MSVFRKAVLDDYEQILRMKRQVHSIHVHACPEFYKSIEVPLSLRQFQADLSNEAVDYYVLCDSKTILGYAVVNTRTIANHPIIHDRKILYIEDFCIDEQHRGTGLGTELFKQLEALALREGFDSIELDVWAFNSSARAFYDSMGMECSRIRLHKALS